MKLAIISDTHFGYARFEEDAFVQAERAFLDAQEKADLIIYAGDVFDTKIPKLETIHRAIDILRKVRIPIYTIHGNHERRSRDMINPVELLAQMGLLCHLHGEAATFEKNGETVQVFGLGNVPEEFAQTALQKALERFNPRPDAFKVLVLHQSIRDLIPFAEEEISTEELESLPFDLFINGHIHSHHVLMKGRLLIPGSTVITQLKKEEVLPRGYVLYDTQQRAHQFIPISCRPFFFEEMTFQEGTPADIRERVAKRAHELRQQHPDALIRMVINGTLKEGFQGSDLDLDVPGVFVDNHLTQASLKANLEKIRKLREEKLSVKEIAIQELKEKTKGVSLFDPVEMFDHLLLGVEEAAEYLGGLRKK